MLPRVSVAIEEIKQIVARLPGVDELTTFQEERIALLEFVEKTLAYHTLS